MTKLNLYVATILFILTTAGLYHGTFANVQQNRAEEFFIASNNYSVSSFNEKDLQLSSSTVLTYQIYLPIIISPPPFNAKKGVGTRGQACDDLRLLEASWYYQWSVYPDPNCNGIDKRFVPRISRANHMSQLSQAVANAQASGWLIGFTEPNLSSWSYITPSQAAIYWRQIEQEAGNIKLVSPSPSQHKPSWLWEMVDAYRNKYGTNPHFDAIGWNIYDRSPNDVKNYLTKRRNEALARGYNVPIWVLEYGGECWNSSNGKTGNEAVITEVTDWFNKTPWVDRYAWFSNRINSGEVNVPGWQSCTLINLDNNQLSNLGKLYRPY